MTKLRNISSKTSENFHILSICFLYSVHDFWTCICKTAIILLFGVYVFLKSHFFYSISMYRCFFMKNSRNVRHENSLIFLKISIKWQISIFLLFFVQPCYKPYVRYPSNLNYTVTVTVM
jgi:hypothetical protein